MPAGMYDAGIRAIMLGNVDLVNDTISAVAVASSGSYIPDFQLDANQSDIPEEYQAAEIPLTGKTVDSSLRFLADDTVFPEIESGKVVEGIAIIRDSGSMASSTLIAFLVPDIDTASDGSSYTCQWDRALGIFNLAAE
jgi:hypothetical protein